MFDYVWLVSVHLVVDGVLSNFRQPKFKRQALQRRRPTYRMAPSLQGGTRWTTRRFSRCDPRLTWTKGNDKLIFSCAGLFICNEPRTLQYRWVSSRLVPVLVQLLYVLWSQ